MRKLKLSISISMALIIILAAFTDVRYVRSYPGGTLAWRNDEAYLFLGAGQTGYRFRWLEYPLVVVGEYFYAPPSPEHQYGSTTVIHITPSTLERQKVEFGEDTSRSGSFFTPFDDGFYAMCEGGKLCKWGNNGFQPATEEEKRRFGGIEHLVRDDMNNKVINGWSVREIRSRDEHFQVSIGKKVVISVQSKADKARQFPRASVELLRSGQPPERLYDVDGAPQRVSKAEYNKDFPNLPIKD